MHPISTVVFDKFILSADDSGIWVSDFFNNDNGELDSTFRERIIDLDNAINVIKEKMDINFYTEDQRAMWLTDINNFFKKVNKEFGKAFRNNFNKQDNEDCYICGKYKHICEAHHLYPIKQQIKDGVLPSEPINWSVWLCPTHHRLIHKQLSFNMISHYLWTVPFSLSAEKDGVEIEKIQYLLNCYVSLRNGFLIKKEQEMKKNFIGPVYPHIEFHANKYHEKNYGDKPFN